MKTSRNILIIASVLFFTSCESWLDLQPEGQATFDQLYSQGDGYRAVLNGLYKAMGAGELYGVDLQFGLIDCMSQQYDLTKYENTMMNQKYLDAEKMDYLSMNLNSTIDQIWLSGYKIIANANDLLQNIQTASPDIFAGGEMERSVIMGEAYACRALMHFDLLRLFAPALVNDDGAAYLPYVVTYPDIQPSGIPVKPYLEKVIADLEEAQALTRMYDTTGIGRAASSTANARFDKQGMPEGLTDDFFAGRGYRLSYYAITALLARVYQYAGMEDQAFQAADTVLKFAGAAPFYQDDFSGIKTEAIIEKTESFKSKSDLKLKSSLIFAVYNEKEYEKNNLLTYFKTGLDADDRTGTNWFILRMELFHNGGQDESGLDYRYKYLVFPAARSYPISGKWYLDDNERKRDQDATVLPVIRVTEMRYILAECYARKGAYDKAFDILDEIRAARGLQEVPLLRANTWEAFSTCLIEDARREWIAEGQLFYLYKRLNANVNIGKETRPFNRSEYMLPIPKDQSN